LELPYNTVYSASVLGGSFDRPLADWPTKREWHDYAFAEFAAAGYVLSSAYTMVKPKGPSSRFVYRDSVWHGSDMLGTGVASFSHLSGVHFQNVPGWGEYLAALAERRLPIARGLAITDRERLTRETILQLKLGTLALPYFRDKFGVDVLAEFAPAWKRLEEEGKLRLGRDEVTLTRPGLLDVDRLLPSFYDERYRNARYT
jgi:oxygen-independent coproporphyrinogen-3 oxidase